MARRKNKTKNKMIFTPFITYFSKFTWINLILVSKIQKFVDSKNNGEKKNKTRNKTIFTPFITYFSKFT